MGGCGMMIVSDGMVVMMLMMFEDFMLIFFGDV